MGYTDLAFLRSYHDARGNAAWGDASAEDQEKAAAAAATWLDERFGSGFGIGAGGFAGEVPTEVLFAEAEAALAKLEGKDPRAAVAALLDPLGVVAPEPDDANSEPEGLTRETVSAMDKPELLELLRAHGASPDGRASVDRLREEALALVFVDL